MGERRDKWVRPGKWASDKWAHFSGSKHAIAVGLHRACMLKTVSLAQMTAMGPNGPKNG